jgi:hypothetical protein
MGVLPQALEIIFEMQRKRSNEVFLFLKQLSNIQNIFILFFPFSLDPSYFQTS